MFDAFSSGREAPVRTSPFVEGEGQPDYGFGAISSYGLCAGCGRFHGATDATGDGSQGVIVNADDRGGSGPNGKPSLNPADAGAQITRSNTTWAAAIGQATTVTFAFRGSQPGTNGTSQTMPSDTAGYSNFNAAQITATLLALQSWSDVANIVFQRVQDVGSEYSASNNAAILFGNYATGSEGAAAFAYLPASAAQSTLARGSQYQQGDVWVNSSLSYNSTPVLLNYGYQVLTHEIGHAIGLSHPAAYNAGPGVSITYAEHAIYFEDSRQYSLMSYFNAELTGGEHRVNGTGTRYYSAVPLLDDIAAAQRLYGANMTTRTGDTTYGFNSNADRAWFSATSSASLVIFAVWDAGGTDTFDFSGYSQNQVIDLRQGAFSSVGALIGNVAIGMGAVIENAVGGSGADQIRGNSANNRLTGGGGNDAIDGGLGSDTVVFSGNRSQYTITWNGQIGTVVGPDGTDTITNVEFLQFADQTIAAAPTGGLTVAGDPTDDVMTGTALADNLGGLAGNDTINGLDGNDYLDGGSGNDALNGGEGDDLLVGGLGDDALNGGNGQDVADYGGASGSVTVSLAAGTASGAAGSDTLTSIEEVRGSTFADVLTGSGGADVIRGGGGVDVLNGGGGNDRLYAGAPGIGGGGADVTKPSTTVNSSTGAAVAISSTTAYDLMSNPAIVNSTTVPHATVVATASGGTTEFYAITVNNAGQVTIDIDAASFDSVLIIRDSLGNEIARNDDSTTDAGSNFEAGLTVNLPLGGTYYIEVARWASNLPDGTFTYQSLTAGSTYTLHVSNPQATAVPLTQVGSTLNGEAGDDQLFGGTGVDALNGGDGNDVITGGAGNDVISGGIGYDLAGYAGARKAYATVNSTTVVSPNEGTDSLTGIEAAAFVDGLVTFNADSQAAQLMRLYSAAFDREPDALGFHIQLDAIESGVTFSEMARRFLQSDEFTIRFGALNDTQYVQRLYANALNRAPSNSEINDWLAFLNNGGSREALMLIFAESAEHRAISWSTLSNGLWVGDNNAEAVARLADTVFNRFASVSELATWAPAIGTTSSLLAVATAFLASSEGQAMYGGLTNSQFVEKLYQTALNRASDAGGLAAYVSGLNAGTITRAQMIVEFSESAEHRAIVLPSLVGGITTSGPAAAPQESPVQDDAGPQVLPATDAKDDDGDAPQTVPADADAGGGKDAGPQVLPGLEVEASGGKDDGAQVLPALEDDGASAKEAGPQVLPGPTPDADAAKETGPQVLPTLDDDAFLPLPAAEATREWTGLSARLAGVELAAEPVGLGVDDFLPLTLKPEGPQVLPTEAGLDLDGLFGASPAELALQDALAALTPDPSKPVGFEAEDSWHQLPAHDAFQ
ncbi:MAG TPA: M10 family metallopeptidase C-terminal domain-containing protein [Brevundimonas sp.]|jgi:Ca2+-binding RTX toxin-like protein|uniref:M10 family metallopeptidase C-terminal domain-containing protein n=1 Tax=Brevundimonas sp. TaxID=1871086 RepID=UPI002DF172BC|nr:M10 family metallopeptidase C-terminal domain-containing protein [Brevundimonas sp.]